MQHFLQLVSQLCCKTSCRKNCACDIPSLQLATQQNVALQVAGKVELSSTFRNVARQVATCDMSMQLVSQFWRNFWWKMNSDWLVRAARNPRWRACWHLARTLIQTKRNVGSSLTRRKSNYWANCSNVRVSGKVAVLGQKSRRMTLSTSCVSSWTWRVIH